MAEELLDDVLGDAGVDQPGPDRVAELVGVDAHRLAGLVVHADAALPAAELTREAAVGVGPGAVGVVRSIPGNSQGDPSGQRSSTWACWARMVSAALALSGMSCSVPILELEKRRQGQPTLSSMRGLKASWQASPPRSPVSMSKTTRLRTLGLGSRSKLASDSSWAMTNSGTNRGKGSSGLVTSST